MQSKHVHKAKKSNTMILGILAISSMVNGRVVGMHSAATMKAPEHPGQGLVLCV
jgi:hypothetical protein